MIMFLAGGDVRPRRTVYKKGCTMMVYAEYSEMCATVGNRLEISAGRAGRQRDVHVEDIEVARHTDPVIAHRGLLLQRCGGGVRVLRKRSGGA